MKKILNFTILASAVLAAASCNGDYDLKKFDGEIAVGPGIEVPITAETNFSIQLSDILPLDEGSIIKADKSGNIILSINMDEESSSIDVPAISISGYSDDSGDIELTIPEIASDAGFDYLPGKRVSMPCNSDDNTIDIKVGSIPGIVRDIKSIDCADKSSCVFTLKFSDITNVDGVYLSKEDFSITIPEWMKNAASATEGFAVSGGKLIISAENDLVIPTVSDFDIVVEFEGIDLTKFDGENEKFVPGTVGQDNGELIILDNLDVTATALIKADNVSEYPVPAQLANFVIAYEFSGLNISTITAKLSPDMSAFDFKPISIDQSKIPSLLTDADAVLDLRSDFSFKVDLDNQTPFDFGLSSKIVVANNNKDYPKISMAFGKDFDKAPLNAKKNQKNSLTATGKLTDTDNGVSLLYAMPKTIGVEDFNIDMGDNYATITTGQNYSIAYAFGMEANLAFGPDLYLKYVYDVKELNFDGLENVKLTDLKISMDIENSLPISGKIDAALIGSDGQPLKGIKVDSDLKLEKGSLASPSVTGVELKLVQETADALNSLEGVGMRLIIELNEGNSEPLNLGQGIKVKVNSLSSEGGVIINI